LSEDEINRLLDALDPSRRSRLRDLTAGPNALQASPFAVSPGLGGLLNCPLPPPPAPPKNPFAIDYSAGLHGLLNSPPPPQNPFAGVGSSGGLFGSPALSAPTSALSRYTSPPALPVAPYRSAPAPVAIPEVKRKVYFAFSFSDIVRVNNVRQIGKIEPRESTNARTFYGRSIWERRSIKNDEGLKTLMRNGVKYSSAVCVLIGAETWGSRWVKYEIARAVIDARGLFGIHINSLNHNVRRAPDPLNYGDSALNRRRICHRNSAGLSYRIGWENPGL
jgi:hypothetical protein